MVNSNMNTLGIIFPNSYDTFVPDLVNVRLMASIPFASRYRMIDFILSSMSNCGIDSIVLLSTIIISPCRSPWFWSCMGYGSVKTVA